MSNVRYIKWGEQYNGFHIYAKIGNLDVVDKHGYRQMGGVNNENRRSNQSPA